MLKTFFHSLGQLSPIICSQLPEEIYFHTDYRPLVRDIHSNVLDEQTQVPPHMLPPPFLVDIDGNPHPPRYQRLVPGREDCNDTQLIPLVVVAPNGNREVVDDLTGELRGGVADEEVLMAGAAEELANDDPQDRPIIDEMIARMQQVQDQQLMRSGDEQPSPPSANRISTRSQSSSTANVGSSVERQPSNSLSQGPSSSNASSSTNQQRSQTPAPSSQQAPPSGPSSPRDEDMPQMVNMCIWKQRDLVKQLDEVSIRSFYDSKLAQAEEERAIFLAERKKKPILAIIQHLEDTHDMMSYARTRTMKQKRAKMLSIGRNEERGRNRLERRALYDTDESEHEGSVVSEDDEDEEDIKDYSFRNKSKNHESSDDSASTVYSDWSPDGRTFQPPTRQSRRHKNTRNSNCKSFGDHSESEEDTEVEMDATLEDKVKKSKGKVNGITGTKNKSNSNRRKLSESGMDENSNDAFAVELDEVGDGEDKRGKQGSKVQKGKISVTFTKKGLSKYKQVKRVCFDYLIKKDYLSF